MNIMMSITRILMLYGRISYKWSVLKLFRWFHIPPPILLMFLNVVKMSYVELHCGIVCRMLTNKTFTLFSWSSNKTSGRLDSPKSRRPRMPSLVISWVLFPGLVLGDRVWGLKVIIAHSHTLYKRVVSTIWLHTIFLLAVTSSCVNRYQRIQLKED